ncbi:Rho termination factor N-terminal domain-containing protein [Sphingobacterium sp. UBA5670]|uniref:Rho termination factor N-terminal domain-containing protein n=1 Tax=Sphingobacterium sp. UBA5670 TaxID=1947502 RepID=UPI0025E61F59|nr:Rho termination factor N-terminal domain-containing protein [Sphingobacterium sp. UBA5670]
MNTAKSSSHTTAKGQSMGNSKNAAKSAEKKASTSKKSQNGSSEKTKVELLEMAKKMDITGRHDMTKDELMKAIEKQGKK